MFDRGFAGFFYPIFVKRRPFEAPECVDENASPSAVEYLPTSPPIVVEVLCRNPGAHAAPPNIPGAASMVPVSHEQASQPQIALMSASSIPGSSPPLAAPGAVSNQAAPGTVFDQTLAACVDSEDSRAALESALLNKRTTATESTNFFTDRLPSSRLKPLKEIIRPVSSSRLFEKYELFLKDDCQDQMVRAEID